MQQYFSRGSKSLVLRHGPPSFDAFDSLSDAPARCALYSPDGSAFAYATTISTKVLDPDTRKQVCEVPEASVDMYFSPLGNFLVTWTRPKRDPITGEYAKNLKIWNARTGAFQQSYLQRNQGSFRGGWQVQFTADERFCVQQTSKTTLEVSPIIGGAIDGSTATAGKLVVPAGIEDFSVSPGKNPAVSVFVASHSGKPASIRVYKVPSVNHPVAQRTLFKAESVQVQWNALGTALLVVAQTDVDTSNKSYYGESSLYLLSVNSGADQRIALDREGPVHDVAWSPESDEFGVVYGLMPAKTTFFDVRGNEVLSLPLAARNHIKYSPQARFVVVAGFGNLQGQMDVYDRNAVSSNSTFTTASDGKFAKTGEIMAVNSSYYDWSPCGSVLLTATTSPRLRVDNGAKLWDYTGRLLFQYEEDELYAVGWRPRPSQSLDLQFMASVKPHASVLEKPIKQTANKPAYVPPHQRMGGNSMRATRSLYETSQSGSQGRGSGANTKAGKVPEVRVVPTAKPKEKQIRSLVKKLRAIDELKQRQMQGDELEATQVQKIGTEKEVLDKLKALGWSE